MNRQNMLTQPLKLEEFLSATVSSRDVVQSLIPRIREDANAVILDFSGIQLLSRSAAHELLYLRNSLARRNVTIDFVKASDDIAAIMKLVLYSTPTNKADRRIPEVTTFESLVD